MKIFVIILCASIHMLSFSMNLEEDEFANVDKKIKCLKIKDSQSQFFCIEQEQAEQLDFFKNLPPNDDFETSDSKRRKKFFYGLDDYDALKEGSFILGSGDQKAIEDYFCPVDPYLPMPEVENPKITEKKTIDMLIKCANDNSMIQSINTEEMKILIQASDFFGASDATLKNMALHLEDCAGDDPEIHYYMTEHGGKSVASITNAIKIEINQSNEGVLRLQNKGLDTLYGLHSFADDTLEFLDVSANKLIKLDIIALKKIFPRLKYLHAHDNTIKTVIVPENLDDGFFLALENNPIEYISPFKAGQQGTIGIYESNENKISEQAKTVLKQSVLPNFFEKRMHYPYIFRKVLYAALGSFIGFGIVGIGMGQTESIKFETKTLTKSQKDVWMIARVVLGTMLYGINKIQQVGGRTQLSQETLQDIAKAESFAKYAAIGGMILSPIILYFTPYYNGYPVHKPTKIIYRK